MATYEDYKRDLDYSWDKIDDAIDDLVDFFKFALTDGQKQSFYDDLPQYLMIHEIDFITDQVEAMNESSQRRFHRFMGSSLEGWHRRGRVPPIAHRLCIGAIAAPLVGQTDSDHRGFMDTLITTAIQRRNACRPRILSTDYITNADVPMIRSELLVLIMQSKMSPLSIYDPSTLGGYEYAEWLRTHTDEILAALPIIEERDAIRHPDFVRELVVNVSNPLTEGAL